MASAQAKLHTEDDYYNLPENVRAELIEGNLIYSQAVPSRIHQTILGELYTVINNYIKSKGGSCRVYPAPFAVKLRENHKKKSCSLQNSGYHTGTVIRKNQKQRRCGVWRGRSALAARISRRYEEKATSILIKPRFFPNGGRAETV